MSEKLQRIEKLSKALRGETRPVVDAAFADEVLLPELIPFLLPEHWVVAGRSHEEQHHYRQERIRSASQKCLTRHGFCFIGHGGAVGGVVAGPLDEAFLDPPDYSPHIQQHDPADAAAYA